MLKIPSILVLKNILIKIKYLEKNQILVWFFGPLGVIKGNVRGLFNIINYYELLVLNFSSNDLKYIKRKASYCESVAHLVKSSIINIIKGYVAFVRVKGVGYKIEQATPKKLTISLGYSHKIYLGIPTYIKVCVLKKRVVIWSYSLIKLQQFCFILYSLRGNDPYNGKGIIQPHLQKKLKIGKISRV